MDQLSRRRLLQVGVAGTAVALAGCNGLGGDGDESDEEESDEPVTVAAQVDEAASMELQQDLQADQQAIQRELQEGSINESEAQQQQQQAQQEAQSEFEELQAAAVAEIEAEIDETGDLSVTDSVPEQGALLVEGEADAIVALLELEAVAGILPGEQFEAIQQPQPEI